MVTGDQRASDAGDHVGQTTFTGEQIRGLLDMVDGANGDSRPERPVRRIQEAAQLVKLAEELLRETVADARAIPAEGLRAVVDEDGAVRLVSQAPNDKSRSRYGWDAVGAGLGVSKQRAWKKYAGGNP